MGMLKKCRARKFFLYVQDYDGNDPISMRGWSALLWVPIGNRDLQGEGNCVKDDEHIE